jgi:hypothetical protein
MIWNGAHWGLAVGSSLWLAALSAQADPCFLPITGEEPLSEVELEQPGRLAWNPLTLPGYDGLLLRPINRPSKGHFYQIIGTAYQKMAEPAAGSSIIDPEMWTARGGDIFLHDVDGGKIWHWPPGSDEWLELRGIGRWSITAYDDGTQDFYVGSGPKGPLLRWDGDAFVPAGPMPTAFDDATSSQTDLGMPRAILTLPEAGGTFAVAIDWYNENWRSLWFRPFGGDWTLIANKASLESLAPGLLFPGPFRDADVSKDGNTVRLFAGYPREASVLLQRGPDGWKLEAAAPFQAWVTHDSSGMRIALIGETLQNLTERYLLFFERSVEPDPPVLHTLGPGTLVPTPLPDIEVTGESIGSGMLYIGRVARVPGVDPLLIETAEGWHAFDGTGVTALPSLTTDLVGERATIRRVGPIILVQSGKGVFRLSETLVAERIETFPNPEPYYGSVWIEYLDQARLYVTGSTLSDVVHVSEDFETFAPTHSPVVINSLVAPLPDRPGLLLVGPDGLYTFEADCATVRQ